MFWRIWRGERNWLENMYGYDYEYYYYDYEYYYDYGYYYYYEYGEYQDVYVRVYVNDIKRRFDGREVINW